MKKFTADVTVNKNKLPIVEAPHIYGCANDAFQKALCAVYQQPGGLGLKEVEGDTITLDVRVVLTCVMNRRASRRVPEVIAQEKQAQQVKRQARAEERRKAEEQAAQMRKAKRRRITQQIDHAFQTGQESGSEPVAKYITCDTCSSPADFLYVNASLAPGAAVLDENTITDAVCALHNGAANQWQRQYYYKHVAEIVPCGRLEFFYTGIRKIAIKAGKP